MRAPCTAATSKVALSLARRGEQPAARSAEASVSCHCLKAPRQSSTARDVSAAMVTAATGQPDSQSSRTKRARQTSSAPLTT